MAYNRNNYTDRELVGKARSFAIDAHAGQERDGGQPYIIHPEQAANIVSQVTNDPEIIAAAWLHDTVEDAGVTYETLVEEFGTRVADLVMEVSHEGDKVNGHYFPRLKTQEGVMLKYADRLSNLSDMKQWSEGRKQRYINKSKFWADSPSNAVPSDKENQ